MSHQHHGDFMKSPHSPKSEDIDAMSQHSDDMDDDLDRPQTPELPLSLTTHERQGATTAKEPVKVERSMSRSPSPPRHNNNTSKATNNNDSESNGNGNTTSFNGRMSDPRPQEQSTGGAGGEEESCHDRSESMKNSPQSEEDLDMEDSDINPMEEFRSP